MRAEDDIGAVGAKLLYPNDTVQHAGVVVGYGGLPTISSGTGLHDPALAAWLMSTRFSALTGACCDAAAGFIWKSGAWTRVCLSFRRPRFMPELREAGYRNIWNPRAVLSHTNLRPRRASA